MTKSVEITTNHGRIWTSRLVANKEGLLSTFVGPRKDQPNASNAPFVCGTFNGTGEVFASADKRGHLFLFYIRRNRFSLVSKLAKPAQSVVFTKRKNEEVVAASGSVARVYDIDSHRLTATIEAHKHNILAMEGCSLGAWFLTSSLEVCILWDVKTWSKSKSLWAESAHLVDSRFVPPGTDICTSFKDFRVVLWSTANFQMRREFRVDALSEVMHRLAPSKRYICAGGSRSLVVWTHDGELAHMASVPSPVVSLEVGEVREHRKLSDAVFILHDDGNLQVVHLESLQILVTLSATRAIINFSIDPSSLHLIGVLANGLINMWDLDATFAYEREELQQRTRIGAPEHMLIRSLKRRNLPQEPKLPEEKESDGEWREESGVLNELPVSSMTSANVEDSSIALIPDMLDELALKTRRYDEALGFNTGSLPRAASRPREESSTQVNVEAAETSSSVQLNRGETRDESRTALSGRPGAAVGMMPAQTNGHGDQRNELAHAERNGHVENSEDQARNLANGNHGTREELTSTQTNGLRGTREELTSTQTNGHRGTREELIGAQTNGHRGTREELTGTHINGFSETRDEFLHTRANVRLDAPLRVSDTTRHSPFNAVWKRECDSEKRHQVLTESTRANGRMKSDAKRKSARKVETDTSSVPACGSSPLQVEVERDVFAPLQKLYGIENRLSVKKLRSLLLRQGQYPEAQRCLIWRYLLQLPYNVDAFDILAKKGPYPRFSRLRTQFPNHSAKEYHRLEKLLSAFGHYSILFGEISYLPQFLFPFLSLFGRDLCLAFEVCLSVLLNWCHGWFLFFPNLPVALLGRLDDALCTVDPTLHRHLSGLTQVTDRIIWPLMTSCMTEVLCKQDWCQLWDHLVTHYTEPELFFAAILCFLRAFRNSLLKITQTEKLDKFLHNTQPCNMKLIIRDMYVVCKQHFDGGRFFPSTVTSVWAGPFDTPSAIPLPLETYPHFSDFPRSIADEQAQIDRLTAQETRLLDFQNQVRDIEQMTQKMRDEEELFRVQQGELLKASEERQKILSAEDKSLFRERKRIDAAMFQRRLDALKEMQSSTKASLAQEEELRVKENERIIEDMNRRQRDKAYELQARVKEESLLNLEFEAHTQLSSLVQKRRKEESGRSLRQQVSQALKEQELSEEMQKQVWRVEDEQQRVRLNQMKQQKLKELAEAQDEHQRREILMELRLKNLERQISLAGVARERALRKITAEFELKEADAERLRHRTFEFKVQADRRDHDAMAQGLQREQQQNTDNEHSTLHSELRKFGAEVDAKEYQMNEDRETRMKEVFEEQLAIYEEEMDEERARDDVALQEVLQKIRNSRVRNRRSSFDDDEVFFEDPRTTEREKQLVDLIATRESELSTLVKSFHQDAGVMAR